MLPLAGAICFCGFPHHGSFSGTGLWKLGPVLSCGCLHTAHHGGEAFIGAGAPGSWAYRVHSGGGGRRGAQMLIFIPLHPFYEVLNPAPASRVGLPTSVRLI